LNRGFRVTYSELVKKLQTELNRLGESLKVDGDPGAKTIAALKSYDVAVVASKKSQPQPAPIEGPFTHRHPIDWLRGELGQKEVPGSRDNPRIRWYHTHCANIGGKEHPDEVPWCSSVINAAADECGMYKTDNALAASWDGYGYDVGAYVAEGDIVTIKTSSGRHVTLANKKFNRYNDSTFQGLGGNQGNMVKVSTYSCSSIVACRRWKAKPGTKTAPIGTKPGAVEGDGDNESTR
jgi:uncharacterized protein (TIGR02594 family)